MKHCYHFKEAKSTITPALIYYRDIIKDNINKAVSMAGSPDRLWPHVKSHKMAQMILLQMEAGITHFKCATIAEAEMAAGCHASDVLIAYPLVGPNISRFIKLQKAFPSVRFWALGDCREQLESLGEASVTAGVISNVLVDVNMGMDRTGVSLEDLESFYQDCFRMGGLSLRGLHCYDGQLTDHDLEKRRLAAEVPSHRAENIMASLTARGICCDTLIIGGTPSFPCHLSLPGAYFSPGTLFVNDYGYQTKFPDLDYIPGAAILTRVISCPKKGHFTLDLGYKGIASDPVGTRGSIVGFEHARELFQSEEHWAYAMEAGFEADCPKVGDEFYVIPTHICPTSALYPSAVVVENGETAAIWQVTARNRKITY